MDFSALKKENLNHAYLLEGSHEAIVPALREWLLSEGLAPAENIDVSIIPVFYIDDARALRAKQQMSRDGRKVFIVGFDRMIEAAQHALLKTLEEPTAGTHFFLVGRSRDQLLPTVVSRLQVHRPEGRSDTSARDEIARRYLASDLVDRTSLLEKVIKLARESDDDEEKALARRKLVRFLDSLENELHAHLLQGKLSPREISDAARVIISAKRDLADPSPSIKMIFEHLALRVPKIAQ